MKHTRASLALCVISGLLSAMAFSTHSTGWLIWFSFIPFFFVLFQHCQKVSAYALASFMFGMSFYIGVIHWLQELHPLTWIGVSNEVSLLIAYGGIPLISLVVSLFVLAFGVILGLLKPTGFYRVIYPALLWVMMEWAQGLGEVSLPWARLAVSQYQNIYLLQVAQITGHLSIDAIIIAFNAALTLFLIEYVPSKPQFYWKYPSFKGVAVVLGLIAGVYAYGVFKVQTFTKNLSSETHVVGVVQGNIPQGQKWDKNNYWERLNEIEQIYMDHSYALKTEVKPELIVWPESALPIYLRHMPFFQKHFQKLTRETGAYLLTGIFDQVERTQDAPRYNAAVLVTPEGQIDQWYYKRQRVPFGEFLPYRWVLENVPVLGPMLGGLNALNSDLSAGQSPRLIDTPLGKVGTLICFESVYPGVARDSVAKGADLLVVVSNDGWYRDAISLYQHLAHAVLRAVENGRYLVRAGNNGISAFVSPTGEILNETLPMERTHISAHLPKVSGYSKTLYTQWGDWFVGFCLMLFGMSVYFHKSGQAKAKRGQD